MIVYDLVCADGHRFEAWFRNSGVCDAQMSAGEVSCVACGSTEVTKAPMAPAVLGRRRPDRPDPAAETAAAAPGVPAPSEATKQVTLDPAKVAAFHALVALRRKIEADCDYVGDRFADEARRIHYGEVEAHGIYGEATQAEARDLAEEGIEIASIPWVKTDA